MGKGYFIVLEGPDGGGKSTQARLLAEYLRGIGQDAVLTREPGGTPLAEEIRRVILTPSQESLDPMAEILLYAASRIQHVRRLIQPSLDAGRIVICERFIDSSLAYQGYGLGWDLELIKAVNRLAVGEMAPDCVFLLDSEPEAGLARVNRRSEATQGGLDRIEARGLDFQQRVRQGYLELAASNPRVLVINTTRRTIEDIHDELVMRLAKLNILKDNLR
jgi:dTMP kinase